MDRRTPRRLVTVASAVIGASALLTLSALPSSAQEPGPVGEITQDVDDVVTDVGDGVAGITEDVANDVGGAAGGEVGDTTKDLGGAVADGVRDSTSGAGNLVGETGASLDDAVNDLGQQLGPNPPGQTPGETGIDVGRSRGRGRFSDGGSSTAGLDRQIPGIGSDPGSITTTSGDLGGPSVRTSAGSEVPGRTALDAVQAIAFPLGLIALAAAFLAIQGRLDRADPKLSVAILDPEDDMLSFR